MVGVVLVVFLELVDVGVAVCWFDDETCEADVLFVAPGAFVLFVLPELKLLFILGEVFAKELFELGVVVVVVVPVVVIVGSEDSLDIFEDDLFKIDDVLLVDDVDEFVI